MKRLILFLAIALLFVLLSGAGGTALGPRAAHADGFIDFEGGVDGQVIQSSIPGLQFTTTAGYDWIYGDWRTGSYNGPYPNGAYHSNGDFFAWLGPNQGAGRIDFTEGCATYLQAYVSSQSGLTAEAYYSDGTLAATAFVPGNLYTGEMERLRVDAPPGDCFHYVILHDSGNYWLIDDLSTDAAGVPATRPPVVFLPGLMGSRLDHYDACVGETETDAQEIWPAVPTMLSSLFDDHLEVLRLDESGTQPANGCDIITVNHETNLNFENGAIRLVGPDWSFWPFPFDFYGPLIDELKVKGYSVYAYGYDWRLDMAQTANQLDAFIQEVRATHEGAQVNIVAHSLGGLLARHYVTSHPDRAASVEQVISLGTPYLGAPKALRTLRWGDTGSPGTLWGAIGLDPQRVKGLVQNAPSFYQILPTENYFHVQGSPYRFNGDLYNYGQTDSMLSQDHNAGILENAHVFHDSAMDDWGSTSLPVAYRIIAGSAIEETPGVLEERTHITWGGYQLITWDMRNVNGDGTVPFPSAVLQGNGYDYSGGVPIWYTNGLDHMQLAKTGYVIDFVAALLATPPNPTAMQRVQAAAEEIERAGVPLYRGDPVTFSSSQGVPDSPEALPPVPPEMSNTPFAVDGAQIAIFGATAAHVYDAYGNHTGTVSEERFETQIPRSSFTAVENTILITIPAEASYSVMVESEDPAEVDVRLRDLEGVTGSLIQRTITYEDASLGEGGTVTFSYDPSDDYAASPYLHLDTDGDGTVDDVLSAMGDLDAAASQDVVAPEVTVTVAGTETPIGTYEGPVTVTIDATDDLSGLAKLEYATDEQTVQNYTEPFTVDAHLTCFIVVRATDYAGNEHSTRVLIGGFSQHLPLTLLSGN